MRGEWGFDWPTKACSGLCGLCLGGGGFAAAGLVGLAIRRQQHGHSPTLHTRVGFDLGDVFQTFCDLPHGLHAEVLMGHLPAAEEHGELDFVVVFEELACLVDFDIQIVIVDRGAQANTTKLALLGVAFGFLLFFALLLLPLAVIHDSANRWFGAGRDFHQIQTSFTSSAFGFVGFDDARLLIVLINQSDWRQPNHVIDTKALARFFLQRSKTSPSDGQISKINTVSMSAVATAFGSLTFKP